MIEYYVLGCRLNSGGGIVWDEVNPDFFGVYVRDSEGSSEHLGDFDSRDSAEEFLRELVKPVIPVVGSDYGTL